MPVCPAMANTRCMVCLRIAYAMCASLVGGGSSSSGSGSEMVRTKNPLNPTFDLNWVNSCLCELCYRTATELFKIDLAPGGAYAEFGQSLSAFLRRCAQPGAFIAVAISWSDHPIETRGSIVVQCIILHTAFRQDRMTRWMGPGRVGALMGWRLVGLQATKPPSSGHRPLSAPAVTSSQQL